MIRTIIVAAILCTLCLPAGHAEARAYHDGPAALEPLPRGGTAMIRPAPEASMDEPGSPLRIDGDGDGTIDKDEAVAHYSWLFRLLDLNRDRIIRIVEFVEVLQIRGPDDRRQARRTRLEGMFQRLDGNGDRAVDEDEFLVACDAHFALVDDDGDGRVSVRDFESGRPL